MWWARAPGSLADLSNWFPGFWVVRDFPETWKTAKYLFCYFVDSHQSNSESADIKLHKGKAAENNTHSQHREVTALATLC